MMFKTKQFGLSVQVNFSTVTSHPLLHPKTQPPGLGVLLGTMSIAPPEPLGHFLKLDSRRGTTKRGKKQAFHWSSGLAHQSSFIIGTIYFQVSFCFTKM
jgi:hypothetical protein